MLEPVNLPFILAICPTYKRPLCLANAVACFVKQSYPSERRHLVICDDAPQFDSQTAPDAEGGWTLFATQVRYPHLPVKFNAIVDYAIEKLKLAPDIVAVWEDDDVYLPWHLEAIANGWRTGATFFTHAQIWSTHKEPKGVAHLARAASHHGSWAFSSELFHRVGKYPVVDRLGFDQRMGALLIRHGRRLVMQQPRPSYIYRWDGIPFHGSQQNGDRYPAFWKSLEQRSAPHVGVLIPSFDGETKALFRQIAPDASLSLGPQP